MTHDDEPDDRSERRRALLRGLCLTLVIGIPFLLANLDALTVVVTAFFGCFLAGFNNRRPMVMPVAYGGLLALILMGILLTLLDGAYDGLALLCLLGFCASLAGAAAGERAATGERDR
ncbi:MAG TPA: hypothetical protein VL172_13365 [Kofleriaceae bacterium]|jgi:uncharacterized membrane protein YccC|nr:hypothetical protein [Kofleriaceae bacterium]